MIFYSINYFGFLYTSCNSIAKCYSNMLKNKENKQFKNLLIFYKLFQKLINNEQLNYENFSPTFE